MWPPAAYARAARVLQTGGLVAYPTEAVYGLGCDPADRFAVQRLCELKQRKLTAGLILLAADLWQLPGWIDPDEAEWQNLVSETRKPTTWVVRAGPLAGPWITGGRETVAVRLSQHPVAAALAAAAGFPLVSTSANRRGRRPARQAGQVRRWFGAELDLVLDGATGGAARPSEIRLAATGEPLRAG